VEAHTAVKIAMTSNLKSHFIFAVLFSHGEDENDD
jgi:hypothetical protein